MQILQDLPTYAWMTFKANLGNVGTMEMVVSCVLKVCCIVCTPKITL